jgi:hypothetical protein
MISSVDSGALLELVWAAPLAAIVAVTAWGLVVYGTARAGEARRCTARSPQSAACCSSRRSSSG